MIAPYGTWSLPPSPTPALDRDALVVRVRNLGKDSWFQRVKVPVTRDAHGRRFIQSARSLADAVATQPRFAICHNIKALVVRENGIPYNNSAIVDTTDRFYVSVDAFA